MRMSWFSLLRAARRTKGKRQQLKAPPLRVRQLERRRVLDAAASSVVVSTIVVADTGQSVPAATTTNATDTPPIVAPVESAAQNSSTAAANATSPAQGLAANTSPVLAVVPDKETNEGQLLDFSGTNFAPPLQLFVDPDAGETYTATIDWGDGTAVQNGTIFYGNGSGAIGGSHTYADDGDYTVTVTVADNNGGSDTKSFHVLVKNVPPVLTTAANQTINEGELLDLSNSGGAPVLGSFTDAGFDNSLNPNGPVLPDIADPLNESFTYDVDWGDGTGAITGAAVTDINGRPGVPSSGTLTGTHMYADSGTYTVTLTVHDDNGGSVTKQFTVTVKNVAPTLTISGAPTVNEGSVYTLNLSSSDPGPDTITQWTINWGDSTEVVSGNPSSVTHTYADGNANYTISATATDEDGTHAAGNTVAVTVLNVAPTLTISGASDVNEGSPYTLNLSSSDPGSDTITQWTINWGDVTEIVSGNPSSVTHTYADGNANYTISATATDEDGTFAAASTVAVSVHNVAPALAINAAADVDEGASYTLNLSSSDPGADTITQWTINWGDGIQVVAGNPTSVVHTYADGNATYTITATATDEDGTYAAGNSVTVNVHNVAPALTISGAADVNEGSPYTLNLSSSDPGADTITQWTINWGDSIQVVSGNPSSVTHTYADGNTNYTISATATDEDGTYAAGNTVAVAVHNVAPTLTISGAADVNEGSTYTLNLSSSDPGADTITQWTINWGDGIQIVSGNPSSVTHTYADGNANYTISATATDEDGTHTAGNTVSVTVHNVAPTLTISGASDVNEGSVYTLNLASSDPGADTITQWTINWGDGIQVVSGNPSSVTHTYADGDANYTISATATDEDGTFAAGNTVAVTVHNVAPTLGISGAADVNEGSAYTLNLSSSDPGTDTITHWTINWGDSIQVVSGNPSSVTHTYADGDTNYTISATATDEDGTFAAGNTVAVMVHNVAPTLVISGAATVNEGSIYTLNLSSSDPGTDTITQWTINWGDSIQVVSGNPSSVTHTYADGDTNYTISATATDEDGTFASNTINVAVKNVAPTVALNVVSDINENDTVTLSGSYTDAGRADGQTLVINWGDPNYPAVSTFAIPAINKADGTPLLTTGTILSSTDGTQLSIDTIDASTGKVTFHVTHQYLDDGSSTAGNGSVSDSVTIGATITDDDGQSGTDSKTFTVKNVASTISLTPVADINENDTVTLSGSYTDVGRSDGQTLVINWGDPNNPAVSTFAIPAIHKPDGSPLLTTGTILSSTDGSQLTIDDVNTSTGKVTFHVLHQYLDDGSSTAGNGSVSDSVTISATITDDDGQNGTDSKTFNVKNVAPTVALTPVSDISENDTVTLSGSYTDLGRSDSQKLVISWGDPNYPAVSTFAIPAIHKADGTPLLTAGAILSSSDGTQLTIDNVDASTGKVTFHLSHQYLDDGSSTAGNGSASDSVTISATITDDDGQSGTDSKTFTVKNVAPTVSLTPVSDINENDTVTLNGSYTDTGRSDGQTLVINWGDPNYPAVSTFAIPAIHKADGTPLLTTGTIASSTDGTQLTIDSVDASTGKVTFHLSHQYLDDGSSTAGNGSASDSATISATITDDDGQSGTDSKTFTVKNVAPTPTLTPVSDINENDTVTLSGSYTDTGRSDGQTLVINWGDPNYPAVSTFAIPAIHKPDGTPLLTTGTILSSTDGTQLTIDSVDASTGKVTFHLSHQYLDDGSSTAGNGSASDSVTISATITDDDGQSGTDSKTFTVKNVAPTIALTPVSDINENDSVTLNGSYTDTGRSDGQTLVINWGDPNYPAVSTFAIPAIHKADGTPLLTTGTILSSTDGTQLIIDSVDASTGKVTFHLSHQYLDDGSSTTGNGSAFDSVTISATVTDDDGQSGTDSKTFTVKNVAPTVTLTPVSDINENDTVTLNGSYTDLGRSDHQTLVISWGDPNYPAVSTFAIPAIHKPDGTTLLTTGPIASSTDGAQLVIDNIDATTGKVTFHVLHQYLDDGPSTTGNSTPSDAVTIQATIADDDGQSGADSKTFNVKNVAPTVTLTPVSDINENDTVTLTGSYTDLGRSDNQTLVINWGDPNYPTVSTFAIPAIHNPDGTTLLTTGPIASSTDGTQLVIDAIDASTGKVTFHLVHQYLDDGSSTAGNGSASDSVTISATITDDDGQLGTDSKTFTVKNVAPTVTLTPVSDINENDTVTLTGSYTDLGRSDHQTLVINWNDPNDAALATFAIPAIHNPDGTTLLATGPINSTTDDTQLVIDSIDASTGKVTFHLVHQYLDDGLSVAGNGSASDPVTITATITDDDGQSGTDSKSFTIKNLLPELTLVTDRTRDEGQLLDLSGTSGALNLGSFTDIGSSDKHVAQINWGDGHIEVGIVTEVGGNGTITGFHTYADNGTYTVTVRIADDDMGAFGDPTKFSTGAENTDFVQKTFKVVVSNVDPSLRNTTGLTVKEGEAFVVSADSDSATKDLGVLLQDPGFDNLLNAGNVDNGGETQETFTSMTIDWDDGKSDNFTIDNLKRILGTAGNLTTAGTMTTVPLEIGHTYADNGVYTVKVTVMDDDMAALKTLTFEIVVTNVDPTLSITSVQGDPTTTATISESGSVTFGADFKDPGFNNPTNAGRASNGGETVESFSFEIDWGDGRNLDSPTDVPLADVTDGKPGTLTTGKFGGTHTYLDDGTYTVTVTIHDDDGGKHVQQFTVIVDNVAPTIQPDGADPPFQGDQVSSDGFTNIRLTYSDPGSDNTINPRDRVLPNISDPKHESFTHVIDWGDGRVDAVHTYAAPGTYTVSVLVPGSSTPQTFTFVVTDISKPPVLTLVGEQLGLNSGDPAQAFEYTVNWGDDTTGNKSVEQKITLMLRTPAGGPSISTQTTVISSTKSTGPGTFGSFDIRHQYLASPNPDNPAADIPISVLVIDDNNGLDSASITVENPGINTFNVAIDTTPDVPRLELPAQQQALIRLEQQSAAPSSLQPSVTRVARSEMTAASDRYLLLVVVSPEGKVIDQYRLSDEALSDLRGLFATLPDNRYQIFLVRTDSNSKRLVMDVFVRRGRIIEPSDDSEGTRDRVPTAEGAQPMNAEQKNVPQNGAQPAGGPQQQVVPLQNNPLLQPVPGEKTGAAIESVRPAIGAADVAPPSPLEELNNAPPARMRASMRWALPLAGAGLVASRESWSARLGTALETADDKAWQRLRRAGRLGRSTDKSGHKSPAGQEKQPTTPSNPS